MWSAVGESFAVSPWSQRDTAAIIDLAKGDVVSIPDASPAPWYRETVGLIPGPRLVRISMSANGADSAVQFVDLHGRVTVEWPLRKAAKLMDLSSDGKLLAVDLMGSLENPLTAHAHEIAILNIADFVEVARWSMPNATNYSGGFLIPNAFCIAKDAAAAKIEHEVVCRDVATGADSFRFTVPKGPIGLQTLGNNLLVQHTNVTVLPFRMFDSDYVLGHEDRYLLIKQGAYRLIQWRMPRSVDFGVDSAVSADGKMMAIGDKGKLALYRILAR